MSIDDELLEQLNLLDDTQKQHVLDFARILTKKTPIKGESGKSIIQATGFFDPESLNEIAAAIHDGCEEVDWRGWE